MNLSGTTSIDLQSFAAHLDREYYELIEQGNRRMVNALSEAQGISGEYFQLCRDFSAAVQSSMETRRMVLVPYLSQLQEKEANGHNCSTCSGVCKVQHSMHVANITASHTQLRSLIDKIASLREGAGPGGSVGSHESAMTSMILDLFDLEEKQLIPEIVKAQKTINAH